MLPVEEAIKNTNYYESIEQFIDFESNEILMDDVWLWRSKEGVVEKLSGCSDYDIRKMLCLIIEQIFLKGGFPIDEDFGLAKPLLSEIEGLSINEKAVKLAHFQMDNPDYGEDGNGIWFFS
ncbi:MAG TPA: hypothetical protein PK856_01545 [Vitreoscilla sp.]|nr:hypothetical protein [Vitreoscilla sp.]